MRKSKFISKVKKPVKKPKKKAVPHGVPTTFNGVNLRSGLEKNCYRRLLESGITDFNYEHDVFTLQDKFTFNGTSYQVYKRMMTHDQCVKEGLKSRFKNKNKPKYVYQFGEVTNNLRAITIKPDFSKLNYELKTGWIIETKGDYTNEYQLKLRLFKKYLNNNGWLIDYFAPNNLTSINKSIEIIKKKYYDKSRT